MCLLPGRKGEITLFFWVATVQKKKPKLNLSKTLLDPTFGKVWQNATLQKKKKKKKKSHCQLESKKMSSSKMYSFDTSCLYLIKVELAHLRPRDS